VSEIIFGTGNTRRSIIIINLWMIKRACDLTKSIVWATQTPLSLSFSLSLCFSSFEGVAGRQAGRHNSMKTLSFIV
jgi:hypothetical protein